MSAGFVPVRKAGKLPWQMVPRGPRSSTARTSWRSTTTAIKPGEQVLVIDDVLATGGTAAATCRLVEELGGVIVGIGFLLEIDGLGSRQRLGERKIDALVTY